jgi:hypothetical protein
MRARPLCILAGSDGLFLAQHSRLIGVLARCFYPFPRHRWEPGWGEFLQENKRLMKRAGIDDGLARKKDGKFGRNVSRLSFHSLRHSFNSAMANADVPLEIRQKLTGHASQDMNKQYTQLELETVRRAVESISRLPAKAPTHANESTSQTGRSDRSP